MGLDMINSLLISEPLRPCPMSSRRPSRSLPDMMDQVTAVQFVGGGPRDVGVFGASIVIKCKDSDKMKALLPTTRQSSRGSSSTTA